MLRVTFFLLFMSMLENYEGIALVPTASMLDFFLFFVAVCRNRKIF